MHIRENENYVTQNTNIIAYFSIPEDTSWSLFSYDKKDTESRNQTSIASYVCEANTTLTILARFNYEIYHINGGWNTLVTICSRGRGVCKHDKYYRSKRYHSKPQTSFRKPIRWNVLRQMLTKKLTEPSEFLLSIFIWSNRQIKELYRHYCSL